MTEVLASDEASADTRSRILAAAAELIALGGVEALTTRAVATAAGVQAPTLYRLFGDKNGLLDAVAEHGMASYVAGKARREPHPDPVVDLIEAWDAHVAFGLGHPAVFAIMQGIGRSGALSPAAHTGLAILRERIRRIARAGRLRVGEERAVSLVHAVGTGTISTLLALPDEARDRGLADAARDAVLAAILDKAPDRERKGPVTAAVTLRAQLGEAKSLTAGERLLMSELLDRIASGAGDLPAASKA